MAKFRYCEYICLLLEFKFHDFDWDEGNILKSQLKHNVFSSEAEEAFYDDDMVILGKQASPLTRESRYALLGKTVMGKVLFVCFTLRNGKYRIISTRTANKREIQIYES